MESEGVNGKADTGRGIQELKNNPPKSERKSISRFEIATIILGVIGIAVAGGTGLAIYLQYRIAAGALHEIEKQYPEFKKSADAAKEAADAARLSAETLRPRLVIMLLTPSPLTPKGFPMDQGKLHVYFQIANYGAVPAVNAQICEFDDVELPNDVARLPYRHCQSSSAWSFGNPIIPPTRPNGLGQGGDGMDGSKHLNGADIVGLKNGNLRAVFSVLAVYEDPAGKVHHAESCVLFTFRQNWGTQRMGPVTWGSEPCSWNARND